MVKYIMDKCSLVNCPVLPSGKDILYTITETNKTFMVEKCTKTGMPIVKCNNAPNDSLFIGIKWIIIND